MERQRRHFSSEEKFGILREHLRGKLSVSQVCEKYQIRRAQYYAWLVAPFGAKALFKAMLCSLGVVASVLALTASFLILGVMVRLPMPEKPLGDLAHDFAVKGIVLAGLAAIASCVLTICAPALWAQARKTRQALKGVESKNDDIESSKL